MEVGEKEITLVAQIIAALNEFHTTTDQKRRTELDVALNELKKSENGFRISFYLLDFKQPTIVQHFGACILYDTIRERWEECISYKPLMNKIKETLLEKLALGAPFLNQSVTNKLTSSLAIFALYSMPDIWPEPIHDLATSWDDKPELLLRVLAELAAEFYRVQIPLAQRSNLKSSLHHKAEDIIKIINVILCDKDASPSLKNAAVECLEQWLRLPGIELAQWQPALLPFLGNLSDRAALARILTVISAHPDLPYMESLAMDLCTFLANITCPAIEEQMDLLNRQYKEFNGVNRDDYVGELEEYGFLISALAGFFETTMRPLLFGCIEKRNGEIFRILCTFFGKISMWPGVYPVDETISDASEVFWNTLKEDLQSLTGSRVNEAVRNEFVAECSTFYIQLLWFVVTKLAYPPQNVYQMFDKEQTEKFERYRFQRVEISSNAFTITPSECTSLLVRLLGEAIVERSICRVEAILFLLERIADYMTEENASTISQILQHCAMLLSWKITNDTYGSDQLGKSLMNLLYSLSHLISTGNGADGQVSVCMELALAFMEITSSAGEALRTIEKFAESQVSHIEIMDRVMQKCYDFFTDNGKSQKLRISALRCVGLSLKTRDVDYVQKSLHMILTPRLKTLQMIAEGRMATTSQSIGSLEEECLFELDVLSTSIATQKPKTESADGESQLMEKNLGEAIHTIMWQCIPLLYDLLQNFGSSGILVDKVCDVLRSILITIQNNASLVLDSYCDVLDFIILKHPFAACKLAKSIILIYSSNNDSSDLIRKIATRIASWFKNINESTYDHQFNEEHVELAYHITKKNWKFVSISPSYGYVFLRSVRDIVLKVLANSKDTNLCRKSSVLLATLIRNIINRGIFTEVLQESGNQLICVVFNRLQTEMVKSIAEAISDILMLFAQNYPQETRQCLRDLPYGSTQEVLNMLKETHNARTFKHMALQFNIQRRKEIEI